MSDNGGANRIIDLAFLLLELWFSGNAITADEETGATLIALSVALSEYDANRHRVAVGRGLVRSQSRESKNV